MRNTPPSAGGVDHDRAAVSGRARAAGPERGGGQATRNVRCPEPVARLASTVQQPGVGNTHPVPHSSPGRVQLLPVCASGLHTGVVTLPPGSVARIASGPLPVIRQAILISCPAVSV